MIKTILNTIDWQYDIKIEFTKKHQYSFYHGNNKLIVISTQRIWSRQEIYHALLHECCHHLVEKPFTNGIQTDMVEFKRFYSKLGYLREYRAEKLLRRIARNKNWAEIILQSNKWVKQYSEQRDTLKYFAPYLRKRIQPYHYAAKRIAREEVLI